MARVTVSTYSIAACDLEAGRWGVAVQSKFLAVGSVVPWAEPNVGAIATQAYANPTFGPDGLSLLRQGLPADEVVEDKGVTILIDPKATMFIIGTEMDFVEDKLQSGFTFRNPNEKGRCGCGESFHV